MGSERRHGRLVRRRRARRRGEGGRCGRGRALRAAGRRRLQLRELIRPKMSRAGASVATLRVRARVVVEGEGGGCRARTWRSDARRAASAPLRARRRRHFRFADFWGRSTTDATSRRRQQQQQQQQQQQAAAAATAAAAARPQENTGSTGQTVQSVRQYRQTGSGDSNAVSIYTHCCAGRDAEGREEAGCKASAG